MRDLEAFFVGVRMARAAIQQRHEERWALEMREWFGG